MWEMRKAKENKIKSREKGQHKSGMEHHHRSSVGPKKSFKGRNSGHKSKRELSRKAAGKVGNTKGPRENIKNSNQPLSKQDNRNRTKQIIKHKREKLIAQKRGIGAEPAPKLVALLNVGGAKVDLGAVRSHLLDYLADGRDYNKTGPVTFRSKKYKTRFTICQATNEIYCMMDLAKIADIVLFVVGEEGITDEGKNIITILKAQGIGSVFAVAQGLAQLDKKRQKPIHKTVLSQFQHEFPTVARVLLLDNKNDADQVFRFLDVMNTHETEWRKERSYMLADNFSFQKTSNPNQQFQSLGDEGKGTLVVSGYLKGGNRMSANLLVHIPYFGDFQLIKILAADDPCPKERAGDMKVDDEGERVLHHFSPEERDTLESENTLDPLAGEQNWPEEQDLKEESFDELEKGAQKIKRKKKKVPKGTSSYQAAWIIDESSSGSGSEEDDEESEGGSERRGKRELREGEGAKKMQQKSEEGADSEEEGSEDDMEDENKFAAPKRNTIHFEGEAQQIESSSEEQMSVQESHFSIRIKDRSNHTLDELEKEELQWPDEVSAPHDTRASVRFQKYRGLKSFRTSSWDSKESLPEDYSRIFQFENWNRAVKRSKKKLSEGAYPGQYVSVHVANFPERLVSLIDPTRPFILGSLFKHEHKMSVLHFTVAKHPSYPVPICSKEDLVFCFGWKRVQVNPIFSEASPNVDKQKYCKFLHAGVNGSASVYAPITFGTAPLVVFKETKDGLHLAGIGSFKKVDPDILIVKKIILTGDPYKIQKRTVFVRNMFYYPEDIKWFKPVELWTKSGRVGNIKEAHGTHGLMKCVFDNPLNHQDTVCMSLYRRVFPKWTSKELIH